MPADLAAAAPRVRQPDNAGPGSPYLRPAELPRWRARLERSWRERLEQMTELSVAYCDAEESRRPRRADGRPAPPWRARLLLRQAVAERRALAEIEAALSRLSGGRYGLCELCGQPIAAAEMSRRPEARYCRACQR